MRLVAESMTAELAGLATLTRLGLALGFATAAFLKLRSPARAEQALAPLGRGPRLTRGAVLGLAAVELSVAGALLFGRTALAAAIAALLLLVGFTAFLVWSRSRGQLAPCGCFGSSRSETDGVLALARNQLLMAAAVLVIGLEWRDPGPDVLAWLDGLSLAQLVALVGGAAAVALAARGAVEAGRRLRAGWVPLRPATSSSAQSTDTASGTGSDEQGGRVLRFTGSAPALTIGMATYNDFDGVYFTLQSLRLYHDLADTELLVVDNHGDEAVRQLVEGWLGARYVLATDVVGTAYPRELVFREATGEAVLCCDSHVLFAEGAIGHLKRYYRDHPRTDDLLQGPLVYDDGTLIATHLEPHWREQMWGTWATDPRGQDPRSEPFEIPMQGLGVFSCRPAGLARLSSGLSGLRRRGGVHPREVPPRREEDDLPSLAALDAPLHSPGRGAFPAPDRGQAPQLPDRTPRARTGHGARPGALLPVPPGGSARRRVPGGRAGGGGPRGSACAAGATAR